MTLGDPITAQPAELLLGGGSSRSGSPNIPAQWATVIDVSGVVQDNSGNEIVRPDLITAATHHVLTGCSGRQFVAYRLRYDDADTPNVDPILTIFGRHNSDDVWQVLYTDADAPGRLVTVNTAVATDTHDGTDFYTEPSPNKHFMQLVGCSEVFATVKTSYGVASGNAALASLQAKVF